MIAQLSRQNCVIIIKLLGMIIIQFTLSRSFVNSRNLVFFIVIVFIGKDREGAVVGFNPKEIRGNK